MLQKKKIGCNRSVMAWVEVERDFLTHSLHAL